MNPTEYWNGVSAPYQIEQSLRFNSGDSAYLNRTPGTAGNRNLWTWSAWVKRSQLGVQQALFQGHDTGAAGGGNENRSGIHFDSSDRLYFQVKQGGTDNYVQVRTTAVYRDPSAWYHVVVVLDTSQGTTAPNGRIKMYVNGQQVETFDNYSVSNLGSNVSYINNTDPHWIGARITAAEYFNGYLAEVNFIDGSALAPTDFGELDDNGVWRPIKYAGSYTGNSFYLKFASGNGTDSSGLSNTWTANNFTTSGTGTDVMSDTPTTNWCTLNPICKPISGVTFSEGNLKVAYPSAPPTGMHVGTLATTNAFYVEAKATAATSNQIYLGVESPDRGNVTTSYPGGGPDGWGYGMSGRIYNNGSTVVDTGTTYTTNDVIGIACDPSSGTIQFFKNGTSVYSGTSVANVPLTICVSQSGGSGNSGTIEINCGQRAFEQTAPSGFSPLNTTNLPAPDIADGSDYFNTVLYTGTGTTNARTDVGFQPDLTWIKIRSAASNHTWYDAIRGSTKVVGSSATDAETTDGSVTPTSTGFTLGSENTSFGSTNGNGYTYVAWNWLGANGTETLTAGSINSTVSANPTAGFSIVSYVGTFAAETIAHGLGNAPNMIITKSRDTADRWQVYHSALGNGYVLRLESYVAAGADAGAWNSTSPTSTVFSVGASVRTNRSGDNFIAYCFAEVEGYSKFGSYTGNGNADGPFVYCGFKPAWILIKRSSSAGSWVIYDVKRDTYNLSQRRLFPDLSAAEESSSTRGIDILSNGFKARNNHDSINGSGTYIFAAFAENPFGGSGVSPATAR